MKNQYGIFEIIRNVISLIYTKCIYKNARLVRLPIFIRGKKHFKYGEGFTTGYNCRIEVNGEGEPKKKLLIGKNVKLGDYVHIAAGEKVTIGDNCLLASKIYISDISHGSYNGDEQDSSPDCPPDLRELVTKPVQIGDNVWIGDNVVILPGVFVGSGAIIGANAVVNKNVPANSIAVGVPAKVVKKYNFDTKKWVRN